MNPYLYYNFTYKALLSGLQVSVKSDGCIARPILNTVQIIDCTAAESGGANQQTALNTRIPWREAWAFSYQQKHLYGTGIFYIVKPASIEALTLTEARQVTFTCVTRGSNLRDPTMDSIDDFLRTDLLGCIETLQTVGFSFPIYYLDYEISYAGQLSGRAHLTPTELFRLTYTGSVTEVKINERHRACVFRLHFNKLQVVSVIWVSRGAVPSILPSDHPANHILL